MTSPVNQDAAAHQQQQQQQLHQQAVARQPASRGEHARYVAAHPRQPLYTDHLSPFWEALPQELKNLFLRADTQPELENLRLDLAEHHPQGAHWPPGNWLHVGHAGIRLEHISLQLDLHWEMPFNCISLSTKEQKHGTISTTKGQ